jgi:hypothetical protein
MRRPRWMLLVTSSLVLTSVLAAAPAVAMSPPDYETPFPCAEQWTGTTRSSHRPSAWSVDFNRPNDVGDLLVAAAPGRVSRVADTGNVSYGRYVIVDHGDGHSSLYAHLNAVWVTAGQQVDQGTVLGVVGDSGGVSGAHLHFEERLGSKVQRPYFHDALYAFGTTSASLNCPDVPLAGDWNNDGPDEVGVFRRSNGVGVFRLYVPGAAQQVVRFGASSDQPVTGDWDGDGQVDLGVRQAGRRIFVLRAADGTTKSVAFGLVPDVPVTGDWNGDNMTDLGVWRPAGARFRLLKGPGSVQTVQLGAVGSVPLTGDWNGDGLTDLGVYDPATATFTLRAVGPDGRTSLDTFAFGAVGDLPVTGDWDGNGVTDVGTWSPGSATYSLRTTPDGQRSTGNVEMQRFGRRR